MKEPVGADASDLYERALVEETVGPTRPIIPAYETGRRVVAELHDFAKDY